MADETPRGRFAKLSFVKNEAEQHDSLPYEDEEEEEEDEVEEQEDGQEDPPSEPDDALAHSFHRLNCHDSAPNPAPIPAPALPPVLPQVVAKGPMNASRTSPAPSDHLRSTSRLHYGPPISSEVNKRLVQKLRRQPSSQSPSASSPAADFQVGPSEEQLRSTWHHLRRADEQASLDRNNRDTCLIRLVRTGNNEMLEEYLVNMNTSYRLPIEVNTPNASQLTPLAIAVHQENDFAIQQLIQHGADPGKSLSMGNNCFHLAADCDERGMCLVGLLEQSLQRFGEEELEAKINATNMFNASPMDVLYLRLRAARDAQQRQPVETMIQVLSRHRARPNMYHTYGGGHRPSPV